MNLSSLFSTPVADLLRGRRREPSIPAVRPAVGATLVCAGLRMTVQAGLHMDLWRWLTQLGWRELKPRENRYDFKPLPTTLVTRLFDCQPEERERVLLAAIRHAVGRSTQRPVAAPARIPE